MDDKLTQNDLRNISLPFEIQISFKSVYNLFVDYASDAKKEHPFHKAAKIIKLEIEKHPELINGFSDFSLLEKHKEVITLLTEPLFPEILQTNEIKSACIPLNLLVFAIRNVFKTF